MHSRMWVWIGLCAVLVLAAANLAILAAFPPEQGHVQEPLKRVNWILPFGPGFEYPGSYESPVIVYDGANETWHLRNVTAYNRAINLGERYSLDPTRPEDIRYTPDIAIEGDKISLDFFIRNLAGEDCARADLAVATKITGLNATTGFSTGDILPGIATTLPIDNLAAGEWREVQVTADLPRPGQEESLILTVDLTAPYAFTTPNGTPIAFDLRMTSITDSDPTPSDYAPDLDYTRVRLPRASATFIVTEIDAPEPVPPPIARTG